MAKENFNPVLMKSELTGFYSYVNVYGDVYAGNFTSATEYENGYAQVTINNEVSYIDLMGVITPRKKPTGTMYYKFMKNLITFEGIPEIFFGNETFCSFVEKELEARLQQKIYQLGKEGKKIDKATILKRQQTIKDLINDKKAKLSNLAKK